ncbi:MAG: ABC transporter permease subunit [Ectothiorhodospiraceae bacterium]|nr:ABC transporter permease subunit [Chromatiales bacterium]MCP5156796.1 ABC transporter permease subunit [Ectothiorhodospiraceae bacterium]
MSVNPTRAIARATLLEARRNRLTWLMLVLVLLGFVLTEFAAEVAITETVELQSALLGAMLRICAVVVTALFVVTSVVREFNDKTIEMLLSLPIPRASYYLGKLLGFAGLGAVIASGCGLVLLLYAPATQVALWSASLACELVLVSAISLLALFTFSQVTPALSAVLAFYALARSIAAFQLIAASPLLASRSFAQQAIGAMVDAIAVVLPDLDRFTASHWLVYHDGGLGDLALVLAQTAVYLLLVSAAAMFDLYRKNL